MVPEFVKEIACSCGMHSDTTLPNQISGFSGAGGTWRRVATREVRLDVAPGLYVLRYVGSVDSRTAPRCGGPIDRVTKPTMITVVGAPGGRG